MSILNRTTRSVAVLFAAISIVNIGCGGPANVSNKAGPTAMREVPAVRLNYRYEGDVPAPSIADALVSTEESRNPAVQADFDANRPQEQLDRTITSPDKKHVFAVYRTVTDLSFEFRLDAYSPEGKLLRKVTSDAMAVHFPDTIVWSPDSTSVAFVAMTRAAGATIMPGSVNVPANSATNTVTNSAVSSAVNTNSSIATDTSTQIPDANANTASDATPTAVAPTPPAPTGILTFRSEQIYTCNADGGALKPLTQNEGLIYFYYVWSPDSSMLAALATTAREWRYLEVLSEGKGEAMVPLGRPRIVEKNGRERLLDDNLTAVHPVWSPDSAKVAVAFGTQIRVYDGGVTAPTQAAIPLKNQLLISSQAYDKDQQRKLQASNTTLDANGVTPTPEPDEPLTTLPDEKSLVSFNPIVEVAWTADDLLYFKTAYLKRMKIEADNVTSFLRWHRLALSPQVVNTPVK